MAQQTVKSKAEPLVESGNEPLLIGIHCWNCGKLLARLPKGSDYQIKCPRCKVMNAKEKTDG